ncbi:MAG: glycosyltransferase family 39 protein [Acidobacteriota bacterium]
MKPILLNLIRAYHSRILLLLLLTVGLEILILIAFNGLGINSAPTKDEASYSLLAENLLDHHRFSWVNEPPYEPIINVTPGYPLFLALIYLLGWRAQVPVLIVQFVLLATTGWLLYLLAARFVNRRAAVIAALLCVTYPPLVFIATYRLTEIFATFLAVGLILLLELSLAHPKRQLQIALLIGGTAGILILVRPSFGLVAIFPLIVYLLHKKIVPWQRRIAMIALLTLGISMCVGPWLLRNFLVSNRVVLSSIAGWSFLISAQQYAQERNFQLTGEDWAEIISENDARRHQVESELHPASIIQEEIAMNERYSTEAIDKLQQVGTLRMIAGLPSRLLAIWGVGDSLIRRFHKIAYVNYAGLILLLIPGIFFCRKHIFKHWALWIIPLYLTVIHLVFHVETRYSFPGRPFLLIYAGVTLDYAFNRLESMRTNPFRESSDSLKQWSSN